MIKEAILALGIMLAPEVEVTRHTLEIVQDFHHFTGGMPAYITSAKRDTREQAILMIKRFHKGVDLYSLYGYNKIKPLIIYLKNSDVSGLAKALETSGLSKHFCGKAIDIRAWGLRSRDVARIYNMQEYGRYKVLVENNPYHIHIEFTKGCDRDYIDERIENGLIR